MAKARTWQVKNTKNSKKYKTLLGTTDFDIPMFGYKSSIFIILVIFGSLIFIPQLFNFFNVKSAMANIALISCVSGFSVSYAQFFIEQRKKICRNFWIIGGLCTLLILVILFSVSYLGILL